MGPIYDRRKEHLGTSDLAIITARRRLLNLARELQQGIEPFPASHGDLYRVRAMDVNTALDDFDSTTAGRAIAAWVDEVRDLRRRRRAQEIMERTAKPK